MNGLQGLLLTGLLALPLAAQAPADAELGCRVCHPGAVRGLQRSAHAALLQRDETGRVCTSCHLGLDDHARAADPGGIGERVPAIEVAACTVCHPGTALRVAAAAHPLTDDDGAPAPRPTAAGARGTPLETDDARWSGLAEFGYRMLHRSGSAAGFRTDLDLDPGLRLREFELRRQGGDGNDFTASAHDLGDPRWDAGATLRRAGRWELGGSRRVDRFRYHASGDAHRVDRDSVQDRGDLALQVAGLRLSAVHVHSDDDGFWLTQRIGDRNLPVQTVVHGVASPRRARSDESEFTVTTAPGELQFTLGASWLEQRQSDRWEYSQPATANPAFPESEDLDARSTLRGPSGRLQIQASSGPISLELGGRVVDHHRRVAAAGTGAGYDVAPFTSTTTSAGSGSSRTWLGDAGLTLRCSDAVAIACGLHWREHRERMSLAESDVSTYPTLGSSTTVDTVADQRTRQRLLDGDVSLLLSPTRTLDLTVGYGFAREQLRVPDLQPADPGDFRAGKTRDDGFLADLRWRPGAFWLLRGDLREFGADGVPLHELVPERTHAAGTDLSFADGGFSASAFLRHRRNENRTSRHHLESLSTGVRSGVHADAWSLDAGYTFTRTDSRTLTNFYFDPDPTPAPTFVGFHGDTHTVDAALHLQPCPRLQASLTASLTATTGSFAVRTLDASARLEWQATTATIVGTDVRDLDYHAGAGVDDWRAVMLTVYCRLEW